jgi:hypothetical protein
MQWPNRRKFGIHVITVMNSSFIHSFIHCEEQLPRNVDAAAQDDATEFAQIAVGEN